MAFSAVASAVVADVFARMGEDATAAPVAAEPFALRALFEGVPEQGGFGGVTTRRAAVVVHVRVADWAAPARGDGITVLGQVRTVTSAEHVDEFRLIWRLETESA